MTLVHKEGWIKLEEPTQQLAPRLTLTHFGVKNSDNTVDLIAADDDPNGPNIAQYTAQSMGPDTKQQLCILAKGTGPIGDGSFMDSLVIMETRQLTRKEDKTL